MAWWSRPGRRRRRRNQRRRDRRRFSTVYWRDLRSPSIKARWIISLRTGPTWCPAQSSGARCRCRQAPGAARRAPWSLRREAVEKIEQLEGVTPIAGDVTDTNGPRTHRSRSLIRGTWRGRRTGELRRRFAADRTGCRRGCWKAFALNCTAARLLTELLPAMRARKWGRGQHQRLNGARGLNAAIAAKAALRNRQRACPRRRRRRRHGEHDSARTYQPATDPATASDRGSRRSFIQAKHPHRLPFRRAGGCGKSRRLPGLSGGALHHGRSHPGRWRHALFRALAAPRRMDLADGCVVLVKFEGAARSAADRQALGPVVFLQPDVASGDGGERGRDDRAPCPPAARPAASSRNPCDPGEG